MGEINEAKRGVYRFLADGIIKTNRIMYEWIRAERISWRNKMN